MTTTAIALRNGMPTGVGREGSHLRLALERAAKGQVVQRYYESRHDFWHQNWKREPERNTRPQWTRYWEWVDAFDVYLEGAPAQLGSGHALENAAQDFQLQRLAYGAGRDNPIARVD